MEKILDIISAKMQQAFTEAGYDASYGRVTVSNRPDLCEYQCNGALAAAKVYKCAPIPIAKAVAENLPTQDFSMIDAVMPGAGVDMSTPDPVNDALNLFGSLIDELDQLLAD